MKPALILACLALLACLAFLPLTAQDSPVPGTKQATTFRTVNGHGIGPEVRFVANSIDQNLGIFYLKGSVEVNLGTYVVTADEAEYFQESGELQAHGDVKIKPSRALLDPRGASQFGIK